MLVMVFLAPAEGVPEVHGWVALHRQAVEFVIGLVVAEPVGPVVCEEQVVSHGVPVEPDRIPHPSDHNFVPECGRTVLVRQVT